MWHIVTRHWQGLIQAVETENTWKRKVWAEFSLGGVWGRYRIPAGADAEQAEPPGALGMWVTHRGWKGNLDQQCPETPACLGSICFPPPAGDKKVFNHIRSVRDHICTANKQLFSSVPKYLFECRQQTLNVTVVKLQYLPKKKKAAQFVGQTFCLLSLCCPGWVSQKVSLNSPTREDFWFSYSMTKVPLLVSYPLITLKLYVRVCFTYMMIQSFCSTFNSKVGGRCYFIYTEASRKKREHLLPLLKCVRWVYTSLWFCDCNFFPTFS